MLMYYVVEKTVKEGDKVKEAGEGEETWRSKPYKEYRLARRVYRFMQKENKNPYVYYHVRMEDSEEKYKDKSKTTYTKTH